MEFRKKVVIDAKRFINWILPNCCVVCHKINENYFCFSCLADLPWLVNVCSLCANEFHVANAHTVCGECLIDPPPFSKVIALFRYGFPIVSLITQLKFKKQLFLGNALGMLLTDRIDHIYHNDSYPECIIPVPLHKKRLRERGYNQALEIARPVSRLGIPLNFRLVNRIIETQPQTLLERDQRKKNVANAFCIDKKVVMNHVAIIDDVITTGSTVNELALALKNKGVERVDVWAIAKA